MPIRWGNYKVTGLHDELMQKAGKPRPYSEALCEYLRSLSDKEINELKAASDSAIHVMGITFRVYHQEEGSIDRAWPFDIIPRLIDKSEWSEIELGLKQRVRALNMFIDDIYNDQNIIKDGVFPASMLKKSKNFLLTISY